jgi:uncharacterized Zn finger protein
MSWYPPYVSVAEKRAKAERKLKSLKKKNPGLKPVVIEGRTLAQTWWGKSWNNNLERYADFSNRIGRGRSYVRHRAVLDLQIKSGKVTALVLGSARKPYKIEINIKPVKLAKWAVLRRDCQGQLKSLQDLLAGKFPKDLAKIFFSEDSGLFPAPEDITFDCSCPDWAEMCKHVAAALYGIGARFDEDPRLFFKLRGVKIDDLITQAVRDKTDSLLKKSKKRSGKVIDDADLGAVFGIKMEDEPDFSKKPGPAKKMVRVKKSTKVNKNEAPERSKRVRKSGKIVRGKTVPETRSESQPESFLEEVFGLISASVDGCSMTQLATATGYPRSRLYGIVHRLKQQKKIKTESRGVYELK